MQGAKQHQQNSKQLKQQYRQNKPAYNYGPDFDDDLEDEEERGEWGSKAEFILSCIGYSVRYTGLHNLVKTGCSCPLFF